MRPWLCKLTIAKARGKGILGVNLQRSRLGPALCGPESALMGSKSSFLSQPTTHILCGPRQSYPHFESPQLRQVMQPSIMTTAAVLHLAQSCAPSGKFDFAKASVWRVRASYSARFSSTRRC